MSSILPVRSAAVLSISGTPVWHTIGAVDFYPGWGMMGATLYTMERVTETTYTGTAGVWSISNSAFTAIDWQINTSGADAYLNVANNSVPCAITLALSNAGGQAYFTYVGTVSSLTVGAFGSGVNLTLADVGLTQAHVDALLAAAKAGGAMTGRMVINGASNAIPSGAGFANYTRLTQTQYIEVTGTGTFTTGGTQYTIAGVYKMVQPPFDNAQIGVANPAHLWIEELSGKYYCTASMGVTTDGWMADSLGGPWTPLGGTETGTISGEQFNNFMPWDISIRES